MARPHIYRIGDRVRVLVPKFIDRIGYPVHWASLVPNFRHHPNMLKALKLMGVVEENCCAVKARAAFAFAQGCAKAKNEYNGLGGRLRTIHYLEGDWSSYAVGEHEIIHKRVGRTGEYYPPSGGRRMTDYGWEYDYENGGLADVKSHIILKLNNGLEIEACHVTLV